MASSDSLSVSSMAAGGGGRETRWGAGGGVAGCGGGFDARCDGGGGAEGLRGADGGTEARPEGGGGGTDGRPAARAGGGGGVEARADVGVLLAGGRPSALGPGARASFAASSAGRRDGSGEVSSLESTVGSTTVSSGMAFGISSHPRSTREVRGRAGRFSRSLIPRGGRLAWKSRFGAFSALFSPATGAAGRFPVDSARPHSRPLEPV